MAGNTYVSRLGNIRKNARSSGQTCACKKTENFSCTSKKSEIVSSENNELNCGLQKCCFAVSTTFPVWIGIWKNVLSKIWLVSQVLKPSAILSTSPCFCLLWHWRRANRRTYTSVRIDTYIHIYGQMIGTLIFTHTALMLIILLNLHFPHIIIGFTVGLTVLTQSENRIWIHG